MAKERSDEERERGERGGRRREARDLRLQIFSSFRDLSMSRGASRKLASNEAIKIHHLLKKRKRKEKRKKKKGRKGTKKTARKTVSTLARAPVILCVGIIYDV